MHAPTLLLNADTQTIEESVRGIPRNLPPMSTGETTPHVEAITRMHLNLVSRITELEIQNDELYQSLEDVKRILVEFKRNWEAKTANEKDTDVLLRNIGMIS